MKGQSKIIINKMSTSSQLFVYFLIIIIINNQKAAMKMIPSLGVFAGALLVLGSQAIYTVNPGERALILDNFQGLKLNVYNPGYNFKIPFLQKAIIYDCRLKPIDISVSTGTKDLQTVSISLRILQQPLAQNLPTIHQTLGRDYERKVFNSIGQQVVRTVVAQYDADQLLKNRQNVSKQIRSQLYAKARDFNVDVADVSFMHLGFSKEYSNAVQRRAVQQQLAQRQKFIVLRDQQVKTAQIIRSEAEAQAAKLINQSVKRYGGTQLEIKKLEAAQAIAQLLSKNPNISFIPTNSTTGNLLNLKV